MPRTANTLPDALAQARATVDLTGTDEAPDIPGIRDAWAALKAAQGQPVNIARLTPAHLIALAAQEQPAPAQTLAEAMDRARPATLHAIRRMGIMPRSDMDGAA